MTPAYSKGSIGRAFAVFIHTENQNQASFCPFTLRKVSVHAELTLGHLRYCLTDVPPQSNSPPVTIRKMSRNLLRNCLKLQESPKATLTLFH
jgi:hypothetical protein